MGVRTTEENSVTFTYSGCSDTIEVKISRGIKATRLYINDTSAAIPLEEAIGLFKAALQELETIKADDERRRRTMDRPGG